MIKKQKIRQMYVGGGVSFFKKRLLKKYNLKPYTNKKEPCVFNGLYTRRDYSKLIEHKSHKTVVWCGTDAVNLKRNKHLLKKAGVIRHIAKSIFISKTLTSYGIKHILLPITPTSPTKNYKKRGDSIYFYRGNRRIKYGGKLVDYIKKKTKYKIIEATSKTYSTSQLQKIYEECFLGLRLTKHDGLSNTVLELGLMGRNCIHNGNTPNSIHYKNRDQIIKIIDEEYKKRGDNSQHIVDEVYNFLNISDDWLTINISPNVKPNNKKSVLVNKKTGKKRLKRIIPPPAKKKTNKRKSKINPSPVKKKGINIVRKNKVKNPTIKKRVIKRRRRKEKRIS